MFHGAIALLTEGSFSIISDKSAPGVPTGAPGLRTRIGSEVAAMHDRTGGYTESSFVYARSYFHLNHSRSLHRPP